jgi:hypothetical protein
MLNKNLNDVNIKLRNLKLIAERKNLESKFNKNQPAKKSSYFCGNNILNTNINDLKNRLIKRDQNSHSKIPIIIEDIKSLENNYADDKNKYNPLNTKPPIKPLLNIRVRQPSPFIISYPISGNNEPPKKEPVFIRPNVEKLLQPTIRGIPKDIHKDMASITDTLESCKLKQKKKLCHLSFFKRKFLSSSSFASKSSDKTDSVSSLTCFDTDTDIHSTTTSTSSQTKSIQSSFIKLQ